MQLARTAWFERVYMKASATHIDRAALRIRTQLITTRAAMGNQVRGLLKLFGLRLGAARTPGKRHGRLIALYQQRPDLEPLFAPLVASMGSAPIPAVGKLGVTSVAPKRPNYLRPRISPTQKSLDEDKLSWRVRVSDMRQLGRCVVPCG